MRRIFQMSSILFFSAILVTQFTNCDVYSSGDGLFEQYSVSCAGEECSSTDARVDYIKMRANYTAPLYIMPAAKFIDIGGDCNEGGFPDSVVKWNLYDENNGLKASSDEDPELFQGKCVDGRFSVQVRIMHNYGSDASPVWYYGLQVPPITADPAVYEAHLLEIELKAIDENGDLVTNPALSPESIWLTPLSFAGE